MLDEICLEEWWLSKPEDNEGLAVGGRPCEIQRCNNAQQKFQSAPAKRRCLSREFHTKVIKRRHGCTKLETSDGITITLCGLINTSRSIQNGYSSQVCRDFIYGFPYNWSDYAASACEKSSQDNLKDSNECFKPAALDGCIGAQLHDMVLSHSDLEREVFIEKLSNNLIGILSPQPMDGIERMSTPPEVQTDVLKDSNECFKPAALDGCIGAQLHDMVLSHSDLEREMFIEKLSDNLIGILSPHSMDGNGIERMSTRPEVQTDVLKPESKKLKTRGKKRRRQ